jgi:putative FmdB family regulatory protein
MPTYEYACQTCRKKVSIFFLSIKRAQEETPRCPECNGEKLTRLVSRFMVGRAQGPALEEGGDLSGMEDIERGDPRAIARLMRQMSDETGEPMEPEMEGVLNRLERGEDPESIEADMGDLGAPDSPPADSGSGTP